MNTYVHEELYRGKDLFEKIKTRRIVVCGCGAIGSNLVDNLIRQGSSPFWPLIMIGWRITTDTPRYGVGVILGSSRYELSLLECITIQGFK